MTAASNFSLATMAALLATAPALAANGRPADGPAWSARIGVGTLASPAFRGARTYQVSALPALRIAYGERFFASIEEGLGYAAFKSEQWSAGPVLRVSFGRDEDGGAPFRIAGHRDSALHGLGDLSATAEAGAFVRARLGSWSATAEVRHGLGGHGAALADLALSYAWRFSSPFYDRGGPGIVSLGPRVSLAGASYAMAFFGVDVAQSARSGLPAYSPKGGLMAYGIGGVAVVPVAPRTSLSLILGLERLGAQASRSSLVRIRGSRLQGNLGIFAIYEFAL